MLFTFIANTAPFTPMTRYPEQGDLLNWCLNMGLGTGILLMLVGAGLVVTIIFFLVGLGLGRAGGRR